MNELVRTNIMNESRQRIELQSGLETRQRDINAAVWDALDIAPPGHVLDICTGTFGSSDLAIESGVRFTGIDISRRMLEHHAHKNQVIQSDAANLPFADNTFTGITMVMALNNVFGSHMVAKEVRRVLETGGKIAITDAGPNIKDIKRILWDIGERHEVQTIMPGKVHEFDSFFSSLSPKPGAFGKEKLQLMFGLTVGDYTDVLDQIRQETRMYYQRRGVTSERRIVSAILSRIQEELTKTYFDFVESTFTSEGLVPVTKAGVLTFQEKEENWHVWEGSELIPPYVSLGTIYQAMRMGWVYPIPKHQDLHFPIVKQLPIGVYQKA